MKRSSPTLQQKEYWMFLCFILFASTDENAAVETGVSQAGIITQNPTTPEVGLAPSREPLQPILEKEEPREEGEDDLKGETHIVLFQFGID